MPLDEEEVRERVRELVDKGVRGFVVNLLWSNENANHEQRIKEIIEEEYPDVYLGNMPVVLSSEVSPKKDEYLRTTTTALNALMANVAEEHFLDLTDQLRSYNYDDPLFTVRNTGGVASISRTNPLHLFDAGPVAGVMGSTFLGNLYGESNVLATDMGGTSFDVGMVLENKERVYEFNPVIGRWRFQLSTIETKSIGAGGGSIASVDELGDLQIGPESAGSDPGPACYNQGGRKPTVTDADLVLGYLNPDYFLGGRQSLSVRRAERAIQQHVATPLDISVEEAAYKIRELIDGKMGQEIYKHTAMKGYDPEEFILFSFGGAGPVHACHYADYANVKRIITFPFGSVFNAFGASTMDIMQTYETGTHLTLYESRSDEYLSDYESFNSVVEDLSERAVRDMKEEGFGEDDVTFSLELDCIYANQLHPTRCLSPTMQLESEGDVKAVCEAFNDAYSESYSRGATFPEGGIQLENFKLNAIVQLDDLTPPSAELVGEDPSSARKESRGVLWNIDEGFEQTPVYDRGRLEPGNVVNGPAIVEATGTTYVVSPDKEFRVDEYNNGIME
jgi:N-methylhydantoinase A/acetophenone carboxylase